MQKKSKDIQEVAQPLSQGEKNFKAMHTVAINRDTVPGVTDQDHVFKGMPRKLDQPTASKEIYKDEDESKETYDKGLKRKENYYASEEVVDEATLSAKAARAGEDIGKPGKNFSKIAAAASKKYGSEEAGKKVAGAILKKMREEVEQSEEVVEEVIVEKRVNLKGYLKGGQKKLDKNHNGKLDKQDFEMLRKEEVEELDERDMSNKAKKDAAVAKVGAKNRDEKHLGAKGMRTDVADKIRGREKMSGKDRKQFEEVTEAELKTLGPDSKIKDNKHHNSSDYIKKNTKFAKQADAASDKKVKHDCAMHVEHTEWGPGICVPGAHTIVENSNGEGVVTHYDVMFLHGIEEDVSVEDLNILVSESHEHSRKSMKENYDQDIDYEGEMARAELKAICDKAGKLADMMTDQMQLEAWLQSKISRAKDYIDAVYDYLNYREPKDTAPAQPQASMGTNYASFLNRMGEETTAISKAKKAFESKLIELGYESATVVTEAREVEKTETDEVALSAEEMERIKAILGSD